MNQEEIIKVAEQCGGTMIYVWGAAPRVDNLDVMQYTRMILQELIKEDIKDEKTQDRAGLRGSGPDNSGGTDGGDAVVSVREGPGEVQLGQKGRKKANTKVKESVQESAAPLREGS